MEERDHYIDELLNADFSMTEYGHHLLPYAASYCGGAGDHQDNFFSSEGNLHHLDNGFLSSAAVNRYLPDNGGFFADNHVPPELIDSYPRFRHYQYEDTILDNPLESEFNLLSISTPSYQSGYPRAAPPSIQRLRAQSAARAQNIHNMGMNSYSAGAYENNTNQIPLNGHSNCSSNYGRNNLNGVSSVYRPRAYPPLNCRADYEIGTCNYTYPSYNCRPALTNGIGSSSSSSSSSLMPSRRPIYSSLNDLRGKIFMAAKDQLGCRFLQNKFEEGDREDIHMIFTEVKDHICELMTDQFGNYLIQKFFKVCSEEQMTQLLYLLIKDERKFKEICSDMHGTRAVQKLLEHLTTPEQRSVVIAVLRRITLALIKNNNGQHVIQHCLKYFPNEDNKHILNVVADNCLDVATDKSGCCVLQQCLTHSVGESRDRLIAQITSNALVLSEHPYGNYVVQYILGFKIVQVTSDIMAQLSGNYVSLSMNKYGSNVVEQCLKQSEGDEALPIIEELIHSPNFLRVLQDPYGNYVAQSALMVSKGEAQHTMVRLVLVNYPFLHSHPHGKRVLARTKGIKLRVHD
ncbi:hypothetical protein OROHE_015479 [Orobanche hederae]